MLEMWKWSLREQRLLLVICAVHALAGFVICIALDFPTYIWVSSYTGGYGILVGAFMFLLSLAYLLKLILQDRPAHPIACIGRDLKAMLRSEALVLAVPMLLIWPLFSAAVTGFKVSIPLLFPFDWDTRLMLADRWLHGGHDPWQLLQPWLGRAEITWALNVLYNIWPFALTGSVLWQAMSTRDNALRFQFLLSMVLCWILLSNAMAYLLSSAGPVYYDRVVDGGGATFSELMAYLYSVSETRELWALHMQERLWETYNSDYGTVFAGISAMPSLHVATSLLFALLAWRHSRILGLLFYLYLLGILVGSVHLGWHYALDGYVSLACTLAIWKFSGAVQRTLQRQGKLGRPAPMR